MKLDFEKIVHINPDLVLAYGIGSEVTGYMKKLNELGITVVLNGEYLEKEPLAKAEWVKFIAAFYNKKNIASKNFDKLAQQYNSLKDIASKLKTSDDKILSKIEELKERLISIKEKLKESQKEIIEGKIEQLIKKAIFVDKFRIVTGKWESISPEVLRGAAERIRAKLKDAVVVLASVNPNKAFLVVTSTSKEIPADKVIEKVCLLAKGSGGGRWDFAQGVTSQTDKVEEALSQVKRIVKEILNE